MDAIAVRERRRKSAVRLLCDCGTGRRGGGEKKKKSGADERRWMGGYVRNRDRWGATRRVESTIEPSVSPSLYNDTLHCAINKSMGNTCSSPSIMEILA